VKYPRVRESGSKNGGDVVGDLASVLGNRRSREFAAERKCL